MLVRRGLDVTLIDPGQPSASGVAAGMLAPAFEAALEGADQRRAALYRAGRDRWTALAAAARIDLVQDGARWVPADPDDRVRGAEAYACMQSLGFAVEGAADAPRTPEDWRLDPAASLERLSRGSARRTGRAVAAGGDERQAWVALEGGERLDGDLVVLATGVGSIDCAAARAALDAVTPIKGQIVDVAGAAPPPQVLRSGRAYLTPTREGFRIGATMQAGLSDLAPDAAATRRLLEAAARIWAPARGAANVEARVGVRGASPDGLPLAGAVAPRIAVALAPRRNGWLLAPLVAEVVAAYATGDDPGPFAAALDPLRFQES
jgi:glycine oxidase